MNKPPNPEFGLNPKIEKVDLLQDFYRESSKNSITFTSRVFGNYWLQNLKTILTKNELWQCFFFLILFDWQVVDDYY